MAVVLPKQNRQAGVHLSNPQNVPANDDRLVNKEFIFTAMMDASDITDPTYTAEIDLLGAYIPNPTVNDWVRLDGSGPWVGNTPVRGTGAPRPPSFRYGTTNALPLQARVRLTHNKMNSVGIEGEIV